MPTCVEASFDHSGTTTVISSGASGVCLSCAQRVARAGWRQIFSASRRPDKTGAALQSVSPGIDGRAYPCEVSEESSVAAFFDAILADRQRIDHVIRSVGISPNTEFAEQTQQEWDGVFNTNSTGAFLVVKHAARLTLGNERADECRGKILLVASTNEINSNDPVSAHYDASKAAANMLVRNAAQWLAPRWIDTALNASLPADVRERESQKIWSARWAWHEAMAEAALHVLTPPNCVGQALLADGGYR